MQKMSPYEDSSVSPSSSFEDKDRLEYLLHDMGSAVTAVGLMVDLLDLAAKAEDDSVQRARAVSAQKGCQQLAELCSEAARVIDEHSVNKDEPVGEPWDLMESLVEVVTVYTPIYDLARKKLRLNTTQRPPKFVGSRTLFQRVLTNLVDNGLKHTKTNTMVVVGSIDTPGEFLVWVSDDGQGMPGLNGSDEVLLSHLLENEAYDLNNGTFSSGTGLRFVCRTRRPSTGWCCHSDVE